MNSVTAITTTPNTINALFIAATTLFFTSHTIGREKRVKGYISWGDDSWLVGSGNPCSSLNLDVDVDQADRGGCNSSDSTGLAQR